MFRLVALSFLTTLAGYIILSPDLTQLTNSTYWENWVSTETSGSWKASNRMVTHNGTEFRMKGSNLNGLESGCIAPLGLWDKDLAFYLDFLKDYGFNALRIPVPYEVMANLDLPTGNCVSAEPLFYNGMPVQDMIQIILDECFKRDIYVLFDLHTINGVITEYPWTKDVSEDMVIDAWVHFVKRFATHPALMGVDLKNEPHGLISLKEFFDHCSKVIYNILEYVPEYKGLFFISGVQEHGSAWGGSFDGLPSNSFTGIEHPSSLCLLGIIDRYVLSPHIYGTDVRGYSVKDEGIDAWIHSYGFIWGLQNHWNQSALIPTEYGGYMQIGSTDRDYYERWLKYHRGLGMNSGGFQWTTDGQFSTDTGGLLNGKYHDKDLYKLDFAQRLVDL